MGISQQVGTSIIPIIGPWPGYLLNIDFLKTTFCMDNLYLGHAQLVHGNTFWKWTAINDYWPDTFISALGLLWALMYVDRII